MADEQADILAGEIILVEEAASVLSCTFSLTAAVSFSGAVGTTTE